MDNQIQLTLTLDEATLLGSVTTLGIRALDSDEEGMKHTRSLLDKAIKLWPEATMTLSKKMIALGESVQAHALDELETAHEIT